MKVDYYLSSTTQFAFAFLDSAATAPQGDPETILIFTFIYKKNTQIITTNEHEGFHRIIIAKHACQEQCSILAHPNETLTLVLKNFEGFL